MVPATLQFLIAMIACAINERMQRKLDYTREEVRVLKEILAALTGNGRISFTADQRLRLAVAGKALSPEERKKCCQIVKPGTILGWFRQLAARKYDSSESKVGRTGKRKDIRKLVVEMAPLACRPRTTKGMTASCDLIPVAPSWRATLSISPATVPRATTAAGCNTSSLCLRPSQAPRCASVMPTTSKARREETFVL
jgi:hypothetical protein